MMATASRLRWKRYPILRKKAADDMTPGMRSLTVAIPAFNEEKCIEQTVQAVLAAARIAPDLNVEVLVVDDGSADRTAEIVQGLSQRYGNVRVVRNPTNLGVGSAIRRAIAEANSEKIVIVPGDNDVPDSTLQLLLKNAYLADMVMCYFLNDEIRGRLRFLLSNVFMLIYTTTFNLYVQYINGPAVYPVCGLRKIRLRSTQFSIIAEMNVKLLRQGATFTELASFRIGLGKCGSFSLKSLVESVRVFVQVVADVYFWDRDIYSKRPVRISHAPADSGQASQARSSTSAVA
jgi:glycosyltransferase involved in cell wall biosynthesis